MICESDDVRKSGGAPPRCSLLFEGRFLCVVQLCLPRPIQVTRSHFQPWIIRRTLQTLFLCSFFKTLHLCPSQILTLWMLYTFALLCAVYVNNWPTSHHFDLLSDFVAFQGEPGDLPLGNPRHSLMALQPQGYLLFAQAACSNKVL